MEHLLKQGWTEEDHSSFYKELRELPQEDQSRFVLLQAAHLTKLSDHSDEFLLKAAESLVNFWIMRYSNQAEKGQVDYLLNNIQEALRRL